MQETSDKTRPLFSELLIRTKIFLRLFPVTFFPKEVSQQSRHALSQHSRYLNFATNVRVKDTIKEKRMKANSEFLKKAIRKTEV